MASDDKKKSLWCGNWSQPYDGGGRTTGSIVEASFDDQIVQVLCNSYAKAFYVRKSTQQGSDWDLWQKTEGYSDLDCGALVSLANSKAYCLVHVSVLGDQAYVRTTSDTIVWSKWTSIYNVRSVAPISMVLYKSNAWLYFIHTNKKFYYTKSENGETWTKPEEIKGAPQLGTIPDSKKVHIHCCVYSQGVIMTVVYADHVYVSPSVDGINFHAWNAGTGQETNKFVETKEFQNVVYQARVGFDDVVYMRNSLSVDLIKWSTWASAGFKAGSAVSMVVYNNKLIQAVQGPTDNDVYMRYTSDGKYWTKWSICGDERRKTKAALSQIVYRNVLFQTLISMDDFALTRRIATKEDSSTRFRIDDTIVVSASKRDEDFFYKLFGEHSYARLKSVGSEAPIVASVLKTNQNLTQLDLSNSNIGNEGASTICKSLSVHPNLTWISLNGNQINGPLEPIPSLLSSLTKLKYLYIASNRLGDDGAKAIFSNLESSLSLTFLDVSDNGIERPGAQSFGEALIKTKSLRHIVFSKNSIFNDGCQAIASALEKNKTIQTLELCDNNISLEGSRSIAKMLIENTTLYKLVFREQNLKRTEGTRPLAEALQENQSLTELDLSNNHIGSEGATLLINALALNKKLDKLWLSGNDIEDEGLLGLTKALKENRALREFCLDHNDFRRIGVTALASAISNNLQLTLLDLSHCAVSLDGMKALATVLRAGNTITRLHLADCRLGNAEAEELSTALKSNQTLQVLDLDENKFGPEGLVFVAALIQSNPRIRSLSLWGNIVSDSIINDFAIALKSNTYLKLLKLHMQADSKEMEIMNPSLRTKQNLSDLHLRGRLSTENLRLISQLLAGNTYVSSLSLVDAFIDGDGALALSSFLSSNTSLTSLNLSKNKIDTKGASALCDALAGNNTLVSLNLFDNPIGFDSIPILANLLKGKKSLTNLIVDDEYTDQLDIAYTPDQNKMVVQQVSSSSSSLKSRIDPTD